MLKINKAAEKMAVLSGGDVWKVCESDMTQIETILEIKDLCVEFKTVEGTV